MENNGIKVKKQPERRCVGCGEHFPKRELVRVVRSPEGEISIDLVGKKSGRGVYICKRLDCLKKAIKARRLENSLDCSIPEEVYKRLTEEITVENQ